jgi:hypothetical protein
MPSHATVGAPHAAVLLGLALVLAASSAGCSSEATPGAAGALAQSGAALAPPQDASPAAPQILDAATLARYQAAAPKVAWSTLAQIFASPSTLWFDKATMIPSYQDSVGDGVETPIGARANSMGKSVIVPEGVRLFSDDGETWAFPFAHTAGIDRSTNAFIVNFMSLPPTATGALSPVVVTITDDPNGAEGFGLHRWTWTFPKGTVMGEILFVQTATGDLLPTEVRTRQRYASGWAVNAFRPFPTAASLSTAIKAARPDWQMRANLAAVVAALEGQGALTSRTLTSPAFNDLVTLSGSHDTLPDFDDDALVKDLLTKTPFVSAYGETWKAAGGRAAFAPTTQSTSSIVPVNYEGGLVAVNEQSCSQCHKDAGRAINDFEPAAILYGDIWGEDQIFSFHPYDQDQYPTFNTENRQVRPAFASAGIVVVH